MRVAIVGSRSFAGLPQIIDYIDVELKSESDLSIISGGAAGVDTVARDYAVKRNINFIELKADWRLYGRAAGPIRNKLIVDMADKVYAFWDGQSKGTLHVIEYAKKIGKPCQILVFLENDICIKTAVMTQANKIRTKQALHHKAQ